MRKKPKRCGRWVSELCIPAVCIVAACLGEPGPAAAQSGALRAEPPVLNLGTVGSAYGIDTGLAAPVRIYAPEGAVLQNAGFEPEGDARFRFASPLRRGTPIPPEGLEIGVVFVAAEAGPATSELHVTAGGQEIVVPISAEGVFRATGSLPELVIRERPGGRIAWRELLFEGRTVSVESAEGDFRAGVSRGASAVLIEPIEPEAGRALSGVVRFTIADALRPLVYELPVRAVPADPIVLLASPEPVQARSLSVRYKRAGVRAGKARAVRVRAMRGIETRRLDLQRLPETIEARRRDVRALRRREFDVRLPGRLRMALGARRDGVRAAVLLEGRKRPGNLPEGEDFNAFLVTSLRGDTVRLAEVTPWLEPPRGIDTSPTGRLAVRFLSDGRVLQPVALTRSGVPGGFLVALGILEDTPAGPLYRNIDIIKGYARAKVRPRVVPHVLELSGSFARVELEGFAGDLRSLSAWRALLEPPGANASEPGALAREHILLGGLVERAGVRARRLLHFAGRPDPRAGIETFRLRALRALGNEDAPVRSIAARWKRAAAEPSPGAGARRRLRIALARGEAGLALYRSTVRRDGASLRRLTYRRLSGARAREVRFMGNTEGGLAVRALDEASGRVELRRFKRAADGTPVLARKRALRDLAGRGGGQGASVRGTALRLFGRGRAAVLGGGSLVFADMGADAYENFPPLVDAGASRIVEAGLDGWAAVVLEGSAVDPDGDPVRTTWIASGGIIEDPVMLRTAARFPVGLYTVYLVATDLGPDDRAKSTASDALFVEVLPPAGPFFVRGDANGDGKHDISDPVSILNALFRAAFELRCLDAADVNDDGALDISDPVYLLQYLFQGGAPPPAPFPEAGVDPTADDLGCAG